MTDVMGNATVLERLEELGVAYRGMSTAEFNQFVAAQVREWEPSVKASGAKLN
jgi:tripartite-type tricarboxylate transporter receptor subunit TctC